MWGPDLGGFHRGEYSGEYDPDELATKITTHSVHKGNSKTYV